MSKASHDEYSNSFSGYRISLFRDAPTINWVNVRETRRRVRERLMESRLKMTPIRTLARTRST